MDSQVVFVPVGNVPANGFYFNDSFTGANVTNANWIASSLAGQAVLTARSDASKPTGGIAGVGVSLDEVGSGALRLTDESASQATYVLYDQAFDSDKGVNITFDLFAYGGEGFASGESPGDGLAFFLIDGSTPGASVSPGGFGGALGYSKKATNVDSNIDIPGITGGYLGIGFDEFGSFSNPADTGDGPGRFRDSIAVRGARQGNGLTGYNYLGGTESLTDSGGIDSPSAVGRLQARRMVEIDVDASGSVDISIDLNNDNDFDDANERNLNIAQADPTRPSTYKFGFSASTGASTNIHEVRNLAISPSKTYRQGSPTPTVVSFGGFGTGLTYTEKAPASTITTGLTIEGAPTNITSATVKITNNFSATQDRLTVGSTPSGTNTGTIGNLTWTYDAASGTLTFTGTGATAVDYQNALRQVTYTNSSSAITPDRTVQYTLLSGTSANPTTVTSRNTLVKINPVDDRPTSISLGSTGVPTGQAGAIVGGITVVDPDGPADASSYSFNVTGGGGKFEIVGNATSGFQLKLRAGQTVAADETIPQITVNGNDLGAGVFTQTFDLRPGQRNAEIFWRNPAGAGSEVFWQLRNSNELVAGVDLSAASPYDSSWRLVKAVDMDGDGVRDHVYRKGSEIRYLLFTETNGQTSGVKANVTPTFFGTQFGAASGQAATVDSSYRLVGVENVSGSPQADLIFYNTVTDELVYWTTSGSQIVGAGLFTSASAPNGQGTGQSNLWSVEAVADFDGDRRADILWRNTAGQTVVWGLNGTVVDFARSGLVGAIAPGFELRGVGDFNGDGRQDVVWRNQATGVTAFWLFNGNAAVRAITDNRLGAGANFQIEAVADLNGNGKSDLVWRDTATSRIIVWDLDLSLNGTGNTFQAASLGSGTNFIRNFFGPNPTQQPQVLDVSWKIDAANGIAPAVTPV
jgi:hypothetical protein